MKGARDLALPPLLVETLADGLQVVSIERRGLPLFHARLSLPAGAGADPRGKTGLAQFTLDLLRRGTQKRSAQGVDDLIEGMGAHLSADVSMDEAALSITVPSELREEALDALLEVSLSPAFAPDEVASAHHIRLASPAHCRLNLPLSSPPAVWRCSRCFGCCWRAWPGCSGRD